MSCNKLTKWLVNSDRAPLDAMSPELGAHVRGCSQCSQLLVAIKAQTSVDLTEWQMRRKQFARRRVMAEVRKESRGRRFDSIVDMVGWLLAKPVAILAVLSVFMTVALAITVMSYETKLTDRDTASQQVATRDNLNEKIDSGRHEGVASSLSIRIYSTDGSVFSSDKEKVALQPDNDLIQPGAKVSLAKNASSTLILPECGIVNFQGGGVIQVGRRGFKTTVATFRADFKRSAEPFIVIIPSAVIKVTGTIIDFDISAGEGSLELIEGRAELILSRKRVIDWWPWQKLVIDKNGTNLIDKAELNKPRYPTRHLLETRPSLPSSSPIRVPDKPVPPVVEPDTGNYEHPDPEYAPRGGSTFGTSGS